MWNLEAAKLVARLKDAKNIKHTLLQTKENVIYDILQSDITSCALVYIFLPHNSVLESIIPGGDLLAMAEHNWRHVLMKTWLQMATACRATVTGKLPTTMQHWKAGRWQQIDVPLCNDGHHLLNLSKSAKASENSCYSIICYRSAGLGCRPAASYAKLHFLVGHCRNFIWPPEVSSAWKPLLAAFWPHNNKPPRVQNQSLVSATVSY